MQRVDLTGIENKASKREQLSSPKTYKPTSIQLKLVSRLWQWMTEEFHYKWESREGEKEINGKPTRNFIRWCRKTAHMDQDAWRRAFNHVLEKRREAARNGTEDKCFPPDATTFVEYGRPPAKMYREFDDSSAIDAKPLSKNENAERMAAMRQSLGI